MCAASADTPITKPVTVSTSCGPKKTKKERAFKLFDDNINRLDRCGLIALFERELDMTNSCASMYFHKVKKQRDAA